LSIDNRKQAESCDDWRRRWDWSLHVSLEAIQKRYTPPPPTEIAKQVRCAALRCLLVALGS